MAVSWEALPKKKEERLNTKPTKKEKKKKGNLKRTKERWTGDLQTPGPKQWNQRADSFVGLWVHLAIQGEYLAKLFILHKPK